MTKYKVPLVAEKIAGNFVATPIISGNVSINEEFTGTIDWNHVTEKPETFTPSAHTHTVSDVTDFNEAIAEFLEEGEIIVTAKSAYQSWLEQPGNENKTETEFVESLKGQDGAPGQPGATGATGPQGVPGQPGQTPDLTDYATKQYVNNAIAEIETGEGSGNGTETRNVWIAGNPVENEDGTFNVQLLDENGEPNGDVFENIILLTTNN